MYGKLSIVLEILENKASHCKQAIGTDVCIPIFSRISLSTLTLRSTWPLSEWGLASDAILIPTENVA